MRKRSLALLCALCVLWSAWIGESRTRAASTTVYLLAVNDKWCDLPGGLLPVPVNGTIYVPYLVFDKTVTGVDLGVSCVVSQDQGIKLTLSSGTLTLSFQVHMGICRDRDGNLMNFRAVFRSGNVVYVPASAVCGYFGLSYSALSTNDRGTLIRISSADAAFSDEVFLRMAQLGMAYRYNNITKSQEPPLTPSPVATSPIVAAVPTPAPTPVPPSVSSSAPSRPTPTPSPTPSEPAQEGKEHVRLTLAVDASEAAANLTQLFLAREKVLFLFTPDSLLTQAGLVRQAVAGGHSVGLIVSTDDIKTAEAALERGNLLLSHIARIRTHIVSAPASLTETLSDAGWRCWRPNVSGASTSTLLRALDLRESVAHMTLPASGAVISQVLVRIREDGYDLRQPLETAL